MRWIARAAGVSAAVGALLLLAEPAVGEQGSPLLYRTEQIGGSVAHVLDVDSSRATLKVLDSRDHGQPAMTAAAFATASGAAAVINGPFFDVDGSPMGLLVVDGKQKQGLRSVDWGVFYVDGAGPHIVHTREYGTPKGVSQAFQVGPRLVVDGTALGLKPQSARRTAVCTKKGGHVLLVATETSVQAKDLADWFVAAGCEHALNLDGGPSTQLHLSSGGVEVSETGGTGVPIALGVFPREPAKRESSGGGSGCL